MTTLGIVEKRVTNGSNENDVFLRNEYSTGLLRFARNDVSGEEGKKEAVVAPLPAKVVIASEAKQSSTNNAFRRNAAFFKLKFIRNRSVFTRRTASA